MVRLRPLILWALVLLGEYFCVAAHAEFLENPKAPELKLSTPQRASCIRQIRLLDILEAANNGEIPFDPAALLQLDLPPDINAFLKDRAIFLPPAFGLFKAKVWASKQDAEGTEIFQRMMDWQNVNAIFDPAQLAKIPSTGPVLVIVNHPMGLIDGPIIGSLLHRVRQDFKMMTLTLLKQAGESDERFKKHLVFVVRNAVKDHEKDTNRKAILELSRYLKKSKGAAVIFPAGSVAEPKKDGGLSEKAWEPNMVGIARLSNATIIPMHIEGRNSWLYYSAFRLNPKLRRIFYAREMYNKKGQSFEVTIGDPIASDQLAQFEDDATATEYLKNLVLNLPKTKK